MQPGLERMNKTEGFSVSLQADLTVVATVLSWHQLHFCWKYMKFSGTKTNEALIT